MRDVKEIEFRAGKAVVRKEKVRFDSLPPDHLRIVDCGKIFEVEHWDTSPVRANLLTLLKTAE